MIKISKRMMFFNGLMVQVVAQAVVSSVVVPILRRTFDLCGLVSGKVWRGLI